MRNSWTISRYLIGAVVPYFAFSWLLLSVVLFVQQAGRFSDIFFSVNIPASLIWQLTFALIPNVIAFTCPMAALVGVIIGLSKMQGDSELIAIRAAGVGNFQITFPVAVLGIFLSVFAICVNLYGIPLAARIVRQVAIQTAIYKLESPIEPGVFNTEIAGFTIYVKDGDITDGQWKRVFVYNEDENTGTVRLITSSEGRIDTTDQFSELVLENAVVSTFQKVNPAEKFISEKVGEIRFAIQTRRGELIEKLGATQLTPDELGLAQLSDYAEKKEGNERTEAFILWQRRILLSITPFIFSLLGSSMILRFYRGGRGFGILLALVGLIGYYLLAFFGEQLARTGRVGVFVGSLIPIAASAIAILWFNFAGRVEMFNGIAEKGRELLLSLRPKGKKSQRSNFFVDLTTGLRDFDLILNLVSYYLLTLGFLAAVFLIFTAFELWRFAGTIDGGIWLLAKYLFFLLPFIYIQLAPSAAMIATLATYVIKSRQNEIVTWTAAGQSVYRLLLPCFAFMLFLGILNWGLQELVAPRANQIQDNLRDQLRSRGITTNKSGRYWVASDDRIFSFELNINASDNGLTAMPSCAVSCAIKNLTVYEFSSTEAKLQSLYHVYSAVWEADRIRFVSEARKTSVDEGKVETLVSNGGELTVDSNPFLGIRKKPSQLTTAETREQLDNTESDVERRTFAVALDKKYTALFLPLVIALFTAPFALSLSRKGKVITVGYAVGLWLVFMGITATFEQMGLSGFMPSGVAVWSPLIFFSMLGVFLISKVRT